MFHGHDGSQSATWPPPHGKRRGSTADSGTPQRATDQKSDMWKPFFIFMLVV